MLTRTRCRASEPEILGTFLWQRPVAAHRVVRGHATAPGIRRAHNATAYRGSMDPVSMTAGANPLIPTSWEFTTLLLGGALIALVVVAVVSLSRDRHYTPAQRLLWLLVILAAPVVGPILWLAVGRRHALEPEVRGHGG